MKHRCQFVDSHVTCRLKVEVFTLQDPGHTLHMLGALIVDNGLEQLSGYQCLAKEIHHGNPLVKNVYCINLQRLGFRVSSLLKAAWPKSMSLMTNGFRLATITFSNLMSYHFTRTDAPVFIYKVHDSRIKDVPQTITTVPMCNTTTMAVHHSHHQLRDCLQKCRALPACLPSNIS